MFLIFKKRVNSRNEIEIKSLRYSTLFLSLCVSLDCLHNNDKKRERRYTHSKKEDIQISHLDTPKIIIYRNKEDVSVSNLRSSLHASRVARKSADRISGSTRNKTTISRGGSRRNGEGGVIATSDFVPRLSLLREGAAAAALRGWSRANDRSRSARWSSTLRLIALLLRIIAPDECPRVIVVTGPAGGDHLHGLVLLQLQLLLLSLDQLAAVVSRHRRRCRLIVTPSPLPPSDLRSSG